MTSTDGHSPARARALEEQDSANWQKIERLTRDGWSLRYDPLRDEYVMAHLEVRARSLADVLKAAEGKR